MNEHFKVGTEVAYITEYLYVTEYLYERTLQKRVVRKVTKGGNFYVSFNDGKKSPTMWTPDPDGRPIARASWNESLPKFIEVWNEKHDAELAEQHLVRTTREKLAKVSDAVKAINFRTEEGRKLIDALLGVIKDNEK